MSWVEDTGEMYTMLELLPEVDTWTPFGDIEVEQIPVDRLLVMVIGYIPTLHEVEQVLAGWPDEMAKPDGISWVADRLAAAGVPKAPPS